ncbi:MAG: metal ABC transporter substrate-binding protein [Synergistaceae bacterium]|nr:metal ABC transporter substrate-binding protein [Synergistaceae bacterium]
MRKIFHVIIPALALAFVLSAVAARGSVGHAEAAEGRLKIVATIFPQYDFARAVAGDEADVAMLVRPGSEIHSFDPSPQDIMSMRNADVFIYIGGESDDWVDRILESMDTSKKTVIRLMDSVKPVEEETVEGMQPEDEEEGEEEEAAEYDEHVWTSPANAIKMIRAISDALSGIDAKNADSYRVNSERYINEIARLDGDFRSVVSSAKRKKIVFGDRFPFRYFADEYGLEYRAAFNGCNTESECSAATMAYLINTVRDENIPAVYMIELSNGDIARTIAEQTGANVLTLHSCQSIAKSDFESGATYLSLMEKNVEMLKEGLN